MHKEHRHAVLTSSEICYLDAGLVQRKVIQHVETIDALLHVAALLEIDTLWIQPGSVYARWGADTLAACTWDVKPGTVKLGGEEFLRTLSARRGRIWITVTWPEFSYEWHNKAFPDLLTPGAILACLTYLAQAFEMPIHHNPGVSGRSLMQKYNTSARRLEWLRQPEIDLDTLPAWRGEGYTYQAGIEDPAEYLAIWRQQHEGYTGIVWAHSWDVESQYPHASSVAMLPVGTPDYGYECDNPGWLSRLGGYMTQRPGGKGYDVAPGFYKIRLMSNPGRDNAFFQEMNPLEKDQTWVSSPMLTLLLNEKIPFFQPDEAWIYPEKHAVLSEFGPAFWQARQSLQNFEVYRHPVGRELARYSAKRIGAASVGLLNSPLTKKFNPEMYRPDWWRFIVEEAKVRVYFNMRKVWLEYCELPVMVATDQVIYLSTERDPSKVFPGCFTRPGELGGYKYAWRSGPIQINEDVLACFNPDYSVGKSLVELRRFL